MNMTDKLAKEIKKQITSSDDRKPKPYDAQAKVLRVEDGVAWVHIPGGVEETPVRLTINAKKGDKVNIHVANGSAWITGNSTNPPTDDSTANYAVDLSTNVQKDVVVLNTVVAENIEATNARFTNVEADTAKIHNLEADEIHAGITYTNELIAEDVTTEKLTAASGYIGDLTAEHITAEDIIADHAEIDDLDVNYAKIDMANVNNAWIENGNIKKAEVFDENVFDLSGNRATIARIDASKINVANLRADNLVVRRINGQPVVGGYTLISNTSPGYESKNPQALGWYEFVNAEWVLSTDTTVDTTKAYYQEGNEVSLYDQAYIDALENDLQQQIDGAVETFTGSVVPTLTNYPYTDWYDTSVTPVHDERAKHVGDIYYVTNSSLEEDGYAYRFAFDETQHAYDWVLIKDSAVTRALADISELQTFESETTSWIDETDEGLETIRTNHTALSGVVDKTVKESVQLWFTKANTTAPAKPTAEVTSTSTAGNAWRKVVPAWNASYPNYYYCWQYKFVDGTFGWSDVVRDIAMGETQGTARDAKNTADNALPKSTFQSFESTTFKNVKDTVDEQTTKFTNMTTRLGLNSDGTGANTDIVAKESALEQTVDGISSRVGKTEMHLAGMYATSSTAAGTAAKVATIVPALSNYELAKGAMVTVKFTAANTTASPTLNLNSTGAKAIKTYSGGNLTEAEYKWKAGSTFTFTYNGTNWLMQDSTASVRMNSAETGISQNAEQIALRAKSSDVYTKGQVYTKTETDSAITTKAGEISLSVAQTEIDKTIQPNLEPFFSVESGSTDYWLHARYPYYSYELGDVGYKLENGWAHIDMDNSARSSMAWANIWCRVNNELKKSTEHTFLVEIRNLSVTANNGVNIVVATSTKTAERYDQFNPSGTIRQYINENGSYYLSTTTHADYSSCNRLTDGFIQVSAGVHASFDIRLSLYEGEYSGPYKPYAGDRLYVSQAELKVTSDGIYTEVGKKTDKSSIISTIRQSAESVKIKASQVEIDGTAIFNDTDFQSNLSGAYYKSTNVTSATADKDLNNYKTTGIYHCQTTMTNAPLTNHGTVIVEWNVGTKWQEYYPDNLSYYYKRNWDGTNSAWTSWTQIDAVGAMSKANGANSEEQRVYYRSKVSGTVPKPTAWITNTANKYNDTVRVGNGGWSTKVTPIASGTGSSATKYLYLYTCIQRKTVGGTVTFTDVLLDDTTTVIDGGNIVTGTVTANKLNASDINASKSLTVGAMTDDAANTILNSKVADSMNGYTINWDNNYGSSAAGGEAKTHKYDPLTNQITLNTAGWVMWNGAKRTVPSQEYNPNTMVPYNIPVYLVLRLTSATATTGTIYPVWYANSKWNHLTLGANAATTDNTVGDWTWVEATDIVLGSCVEPASEAQFTDCIIYDPPWTCKQVTNNTVTASSANAIATSAKSTADNAAPKANAVKRTQRIYYQNNSTTAPATPGTASSNWVTDNTGGSGKWTKKRMSYSSSNKYIWTCEQSENAAGTVSYTSVLLDDSTTVIDGGNIITGTVTANQIASNSITADKIAANAITIGDMDSSTASKVNNGNSALTKVNYYNRACQVGNSSNTQTNYWRKFASYTETRTNQDAYIIFDVSNNGDYGANKKFGRLKAHLRTGATVGTASGTTLEWITRGEGISLSDFVLAYKATSGTDVKVELWARCPTSWAGYRFGMVEEGKRASIQTTQLWTLHDSWTADGSASITSGYTQVASTDIDSARTTATTYITNVDSNKGITIKPADASGNDYLQINSIAIDFYRNNVSMVNMNDTDIRVGNPSAGHSFVKSDGLHVYQEASNEVAFFGNTARVGIENSSHLEVTGDSISAIASNGNEYFAITERGGTKTDWVYTSSLNTGYASDSATFDLSSVASSAWSAVASGASFRIKIEFYAQKSGYGLRQYSTKVETFTKGTSKNNTYSTYTQPNTVKMTTSKPTVPSGYTFYGRKVYLGRSTSTAMPFYRIGIDTAESGGGGSCVMGTGTVAAASNQLAIGKYNANDATKVFIIGNGTSDSARSNSFSITDNGNVYAASLDLDYSLYTGNTAYLQSLIIDNHAQAVGYTTSARLTANKAITAGTAASLCSITLEAGTWIIVASAQFPNGSDTTYRRLKISTSSTSAEPPDVQISAHNGHPTTIQSTKIVSIESNTTYYLTVMSAKALTILAGSVDGFNYIKAVRIA